ncbi:MAG: hypothetical protein KC502_16670 [Myxococcales bacterium]|nr:hypothetical protein [Myxococcales bacterium]
MSVPTRLTLALSLAIFAVACGTDGTGDEGDKNQVSACDKKGTIDQHADMQVFRDGQAVKSGNIVSVNAGGLAPGKTVDTAFSVQNPAQADVALELKVTGVSISYTKPDGASDSGKPFECLIAVGGGQYEDCDTADLGVVTPPDASADFCTTGTARKSLDIIVRFAKQDDEIVRRVTLTVFSQNDPQFKGKPFRVVLSTKVGAPAAKLNPEIVTFDVVKLGEVGEEKFGIFNAGEAPLLISQIDVTPNNGKPIEIEVDGKTYKGGTVVPFEPPLAIEPQKSEGVLVKFTATSGAKYQDVIHVHTNDKGGTKKDGVHSIPILANNKVPCLKVVPASQVNFGFVPIGTTSVRKVTLESCGDSDVVLTDLNLTDDKEDVFKIDTKSITALGGKPVSKDNPITIKTNQLVTVDLVCSPEAELKDKDGKPTPYTAKLGMADNTINPGKKLGLSCWGTKTNCPTPVIVSQDGEEIIPQQELNLIGAQSFAGPNQKVAKWKWTILKQPKGSADHKFWPNANAPDVKFGAKTTKDGNTVISVNIAGEYVFQLEVWDDASNENCVAAKQTVLVIPDEAIHVELLWDNPEDKDKLDTGLGNGADMDLHFAHPTASASKLCKKPPEMCGGKACKCQDDLDGDGKADPWFHTLYDAFWFNASPNWGSLNPSVNDNPGLDLDDTDGWGPENLNLKTPEVNTTYRVGVHYWDAHGFGDATANVRIYILGVLKADMTSTPMGECDFWWVKDIEWPSGKLIDVAAGKTNGKYTKNYSPKFAKALGGKCK